MNTSPPWDESAYRIDLPHPLPTDLAPATAEVFRRVWRTTLDLPGFAVIRFAGPVTSHELRAVMLRLVEHFPIRFVPERLGRFDQQVTSRFHRDGAPPRSLLVLGYEPSAVRSRVFVADAHRAAAQDGASVAEFLAANNPMFPAGEAKLRPFVTEVNGPVNEAYILVVNNSLLPIDGANPLGLLHKAEIPEPNPTLSRVINSVGLMVTRDPAGTPKDPVAVAHFLGRNDLD